MSEGNKVNFNEAIEMAMNDVRARGLSEDHMNALFEGESQISPREALMIAHIQHLEAKVYALSSVMDEIASLRGRDRNSSVLIAQSALENLTKTRNLSGGGE